MKGREIAKGCDTLVMFSLFVIVFLYVIQPLVLKWLDWHPQRVYQLFASVEIAILAIGQIWKAYRLGACVFTKIATWLYVGIIAVSIIYIIIPFGHGKMMQIGTYILMAGILAMFIKYVYDLCTSKFGK